MIYLPSFARRNFGFSLVEIIVVVSIIGALSIVAYVAAASFSDSRNNSKRIADINMLKGALDTMILETKTLPEPTANRSFYLTSGAYSHSSSGAYGVSSSFSEDILWKYAISDHPKDPSTGGFYSYGRNYDTKPSYDLAAVIKWDGANTTYLRGTSDGSVLPSLVKAYDQGWFVEDGKTNLLPYNPYGKELIGRIIAFTGAVTITPAKDLTASIVAGDEIKVAAGGIANIKISDGSEITLGNPTSDSVLKISELKMKDDDGLFTRARLILASGEIWTKAPKLREFDGNRSDFEVETQGTVAAVRGTVFGVSNISGAQSFTLYEWKIALSTTANSPINVTGNGAASPGVIEVAEGAKPVIVTVNQNNGAATEVSDTQKASIDQVLTVTDRSIANHIPKITSYSLSGSSLTLNFSEPGASTLKIDTNGSISGGVVEADITNVASKTLELPINPVGTDLSIVLCKNNQLGSICSNAYILRISAANGTLVGLWNLGKKITQATATGSQTACQPWDTRCGGPKLLAFAEFDNDLTIRLTGSGTNTVEPIANYIGGYSAYVPLIDIQWAIMPSSYCVNYAIPLNECNSTLFYTATNPDLWGYEWSNTEQLTIRKQLIEERLHFSASNDNVAWRNYGLMSLSPTNGQTFTGVYIDDYGTDSSLSYNTASLIPLITSASGSVIEIGIRGLGLQKNSDYLRYLLSAEASNGSQIISIYQYPHNGKFALKTVGGSWVIYLDMPEWINPSALYTMRITYGSTADLKTKFEIIGPGIATNGVSASGGSWPLTNVVKLYLGSKSANMTAVNYWNDPIDFIRVSRP